MKQTLGQLRLVHVIGLTILALMALSGCGSAQGPAAAAPSGVQTTPSAESNQAVPSTSTSLTDGPAGSTFAGTFTGDFTGVQGGYDQSVTFSVSLGTAQETQSVNDAPDVFRLELPYTANISVTNLTSRIAPQNLDASLYLFFKINRPICNANLSQPLFSVTLTQPQGSYCFMSVFDIKPIANGQAAPDEVYQLDTTPYVWETMSQNVSPPSPELWTW